LGGGAILGLGPISSGVAPLYISGGGSISGAGSISGTELFHRAFHGETSVHSGASVDGVADGGSAVNGSVFTAATVGVPGAPVMVGQKVPETVS